MTAARLPVRLPTLTSRLAAAAGVATVVAVAVVALVEAYAAFSGALTDLRDDMARLASATSQAAGVALFAFDDDAARAIAADLLAAGGLQAVGLVDEFGRVLAAAGDGDALAAVVAAMPATEGAGAAAGAAPRIDLAADRVAVSVPVDAGTASDGSRVGEIVLVASAEAAYRNAWETFLARISAQAAAGVLVLAAMFVAAHRLAALPLLRLAGAVERRSGEGEDREDLRTVAASRELWLLADRIEKQGAAYRGLIERLDLAITAGDVGILDARVPSAGDPFGDGAEVWWSPAFERRMGYGDGDLSGAPGWWRQALHPDDASAQIDALTAFVEGRPGETACGGAFVAEYRLRTADGRHRWMHCRAVAERTRPGARATRLVAALVDIHQRKAAELELGLYRLRLEDLVAERTDQLRAMQKDLVQAEKMAALGTLVAGVAHEINTPLGVAVTSASLVGDLSEQLMRRAEEGGLTRGDVRGLAGEIVRAAGLLSANLSRSADLVRRFKTIAVDTSAGHARLIELGSYVRDLVGTLAPLARGRPVEISVRTDDEIWLEIDPGAVAQIVTNLVANAVTHGFRAGEGGRVEVGVRAEAREGARTAVLTVKDDGAGIDGRTRERIFEPFFTTRRGEGSSGLGLSIVFNLVVGQLGGRVECTSEPGSGSEFMVCIPAPQVAGGRIQADADGPGRTGR